MGVKLLPSVFSGLTAKCLLQWESGSSPPLGNSMCLGSRLGWEEDLWFPPGCCRKDHIASSLVR